MTETERVRPNHEVLGRKMRAMTPGHLLGAVEARVYGEPETWTEVAEIGFDGEKNIFRDGAGAIIARYDSTLPVEVLVEPAPPPRWVVDGPDAIKCEHPKGVFFRIFRSEMPSPEMFDALQALVETAWDGPVDVAAGAGDPEPSVRDVPGVSDPVVEGPPMMSIRPMPSMRWESDDGTGSGAGRWVPVEELPPSVVRKSHGLVLKADHTLWDPDGEWEMFVHDKWLSVGERYSASAGRDIPVRRKADK